jgi:hypothetical protein
MAEPTLTQALSSVLGAAVPSAARQQLLAATVGRPVAARAEREAVVIPLPPRRQVPVSPAPERPSAA